VVWGEPIDQGRHLLLGGQLRPHHQPYRVHRTRGTLELMTMNREKPSIEVQVIVWVGLAILAAAVGAFVWLFVLGHGFVFPF
jgi:hypothetical protein